MKIFKSVCELPKSTLVVNRIDLVGIALSNVGAIVHCSKDEDHDNELNKTIHVLDELAKEQWSKLSPWERETERKNWTIGLSI